MKTYTIAEEAKFKSMTEQLRLVNSDDQVAEYIKWIIRKSLPETPITPLSEITDNDAIEVAKILKPDDEYTHNSDYGKMYIKQLFKGVMYPVEKTIKLYQYLQSRGYELPKYY